MNIVVSHVHIALQGCLFGRVREMDVSRLTWPYI
jgi:hypothetical protein